MSEEHNEYLSNAETVDLVFNMLVDNNPTAAWTFLQRLGDDPQVVNSWIAVQCDVNNIKQDPQRSAQIGWAGVEYCLSKGYNKGAAIMLHNIGAFFLPDFRTVPDRDTSLVMVKAGVRQVELRRKIGETPQLIWSLWDLGVAYLCSNDYSSAVTTLTEGIKLAQSADDRSAENWCLAMMGKVNILNGDRQTGEAELRSAVSVINEIGEDWEKLAVVEIMESVGMKA